MFGLGAIALAVCLAGCNKSQEAQALVKEAREYQSKGDNKAAIIQLKNALQKNADDAEARYLLGTIYLKTSQPQSAEKELRKAVELGKDRAAVAQSLAAALMMQGQFQKALDETDSLIQAKPEAELYIIRGNALAALAKRSEAKESFQQALNLKKDLPEALIGLAKLAIMERDIDAANRLAEQAVTSNAKDPNAWFFKGDLLQAQGKRDEAIAAFDEVLKLNAKDSSAMLAKARLLISQKKFAEAQNSIATAKKADPNNVMASYIQALLDFTQGKPAPARDALQLVLKVAPEHMPTLLLAGAVQLALDSPQLAEQHLKKYLEKDPENPFARRLLVSALLKNGQPAQAITALAPALKNAKPDVRLYMLAGEAYMRNREFAKATDYLEKANALDPNAAPVHTALALTSLAQGNPSTAVAELERSTTLDAKSPQAGILLAMTHLRLKQFDKALAAAKHLEQEQPDNPLLHNLRGIILREKKDLAGARASFEKALAAQKNFFPAASNLALLDVQEKQPQAAKKRLEDFLAIDNKNEQAMTALARLAMQEGKKDEARTWLERATDEKPGAALPAQLLVQYYLQAGEKQKALAFANKAVTTNPGNAQFTELLGQAQLAASDYPGALASYAKLAALMPDSAELQFRLATIERVLKQESASETSLRKAVRLDPNFEAAQVALGLLALRKGDAKEAQSIAKHLQTALPKSASGFLLEGDASMAVKNPGQAIAAYEKAIALADSGLVAVKLKSALLQAGKVKEADASLARWMKAHPNDKSMQMYLVNTALKEGRNKEAIDQLQAMLRDDPRNVPALNNLAWTLQKEKDPRALEHAEKAYQLAGERPEVLDTLGWVLTEQGKAARAIPLLEKAASLSQDAPDIRFHLAQALVKGGDKAKAKKILEELLAAPKDFSSRDDAKALLKQL